MKEPLEAMILAGLARRSEALGVLGPPAHTELDDWVMQGLARQSEALGALGYWPVDPLLPS